MTYSERGLIARVRYRSSLNTLRCACFVSVLNVHSDRTHAGSTSTVRDTEGLVQVEVRHIGAVVSRTAQPNL